MEYNFVLSEEIVKTVWLEKMSLITGFVRVIENFKSHGIYEFHFPGLESHGI